MTAYAWALVIGCLLLAAWLGAMMVHDLRSGKATWGKGGEDDE